MKVIHYITLFQEIQSKNGIKKSVHYVVKNTPFEIKLSLPDELFPTYSFKSGTLDCTLLLDQNPQKEVDYVKLKPLEYEIHPLSEGKECSVRFRIRVLSTHFEKSLFVIQIRLWLGHQYLQVLTDSFKSVSKQTQIQKKIAEVKGNSFETSASRLNSSSTNFRRVGKKRTKTDELLETLASIQNVQNQQTDLLLKILKEKQPLPSSKNKDSTYQTEGSDIPPVPIKQEYYNTTSRNNSQDMINYQIDNEKYFESALFTLFDSLERLDPNERPKKIRKIIHSNPYLSRPGVNRLISEVYNEYIPIEASNNYQLTMPNINNVGLIQNPANGNVHNPYECFNINCPYRMQMEQLNTFYSDILDDNGTYAGFEI